MAESFDDTLRALIRLIPPARALKDDLERSIHLELYPGTGDLAIQSFHGLQASVARITNDPYVTALALGVAENATDKEKVAMTRLAAGQLLAYLEGQTGLVGMGGNSHSHIQTAPNISMFQGPISGMSPEAIDKMVNMAVKAVKGNKGDEQTAP